MKRVVIHCGPDKTGTSSIQYWSVNHRTFLYEQGIFYPEHYLDPNGISSGHSEQVLSYGEGHNQYGYVDERKLSDLLNQFEATETHTLLLSSENFWHHMGAFKKLIPDVQFIFYVRASMDVNFSSYNQIIKRHGVTREFIAGEPSCRVLEIENFSDVKDAINFRFFDKALFVEGELIKDFLSILNVQLPDAEQSQAQGLQINPSYTYEALEFKRFFNHIALPRPLDKKLDVLLQGLLFDTRSFSLVSDKEYAKYNNALADKLSDLYVEHDLNLDGLSKFLKNVLSKPNKPFIKQQLQADVFSKVLQHIKHLDVNLYDALVQQVQDKRESNDILVKRYPWIESISLAHHEAFVPETKELLKASLEDIYSLDENKIADVLRDMSVIIETLDEATAFELIKLSKKHRPEGAIIHTLYKKLERVVD